MKVSQYFLLLPFSFGFFFTALEPEPSTYDSSSSKKINDNEDEFEASYHSRTSINTFGTPRASPIPPACDAVTHHAEVYSHFDDHCNGNGHVARHNQDEETGLVRERRPLLGTLNASGTDFGEAS